MNQRKGQKKMKQNQQDIKLLKEKIAAAHKRTHTAYDELEAAKEEHRGLLKELVGLQIKDFKEQGIDNPASQIVSVQANGEPIQEERIVFLNKSESELVSFHKEDELS